MMGSPQQGGAGERRRSASREVFGKLRDDLVCFIDLNPVAGPQLKALDNVEVCGDRHD